MDIIKPWKMLTMALYSCVPRRHTSAYNEPSDLLTDMSSVFGFRSIYQLIRAYHLLSLFLTNVPPTIERKWFKRSGALAFRYLFVFVVNLRSLEATA